MGKEHALQVGKSVLKEFAMIAEGDPDNPLDAGFAIGVSAGSKKKILDKNLSELEKYMWD